MQSREEFLQLEELLDGQGDIMKMITGNSSLPEILNRLTSLIEDISPNLIASVLLADNEGTKLHHVAGNKLPKEYIDAINGLEIGPNAGSCGTAAYTRDVVIVEDIKQDPLWNGYSDIAIKHKLHACWSLPLVTTDNKLKGTIAIYYDIPRRPTSLEQKMITMLSKTAVAAIEYKALSSLKYERSLNGRKELNVKHNESLFQNLVRDTTVGIVILKGKEMIVEMVNDSYGRIIGRTTEELLHRPLFDVIPDVQDPYRGMLNNVMTTGEPLFLNNQPYTVRTKDGEISGFLNVVYQPYREEDGTITGAMAICTDITEQVLAKKKLEESEQRIRSIIESAPFPIGVYVGREMRIQFLNRSIIDVWGKGSDLIGKTYAEVLPELANQNIYEKLDEVFTTGVPYHARNQRVDLVYKGVLQPFYFNYSFTPLYDTEGKIYGVMNTAADVTELINAYNDLEESEARARIAIEASEQGTFDINLKTNSFKVSQRLKEIFDVQDESDRQRFISAIHPDDQKIRETAYEEAYKTGILLYESRIVKKDNNLTWIRVKGKIYFDPEGNPERLVGIVHDISEQKLFSKALEKKVEERTAELEQANRQLLAINDELQQFAYVSSHDLQEPLRKIRIYSDMLKQKLSPGSEEIRFAQKIESSAGRMTGLIKSLLEYSRASETGYRFAPVDLNALLKTVLEDYELLISQKNAVITTEPLPEIDAVGLQMNQLFFNIIGNALKFVREGVQPRIHIASRLLSESEKATYKDIEKGKEYVYISIEDNGIGFDQVYASRIFTVFQRLNTNSNFSGYGIGLALCKKVVQAHNGIITAEGELNKGAKFSIVLPVKQAL